MKNLIRLIVFGLILTLSSCSEDPEKRILTVTTDAPDDVTATEATLGGEVTSEGESSVTSRGVVVGLSSNPEIDDEDAVMLEDGDGLGEFSETYTGFDPNTTYHVRAFATNAEGTEYGEDETFTTLEAPDFTVTTNEPTNITATDVTLGGNVLTDGGKPVTTKGVIIGISVNPAIEDPNALAIDMGSGLGAFTDTYTGFDPSTTYHVRAFAINDDGISYGENKTFTTLAGSGCQIVNVTPGNGAVTISTPTTWTKGKVYVITANVSVTSTLTIEAGTIIKISSGRISINSSGKILANGTAAERIVFTSLFDDSYCGDTNGDGAATTPNKGDWTSLYINGGTGNTFKYCDFLYAGKSDGGYNNAVLISVAGTSFEFDNCTFANTLSSGNSTAFAFHGGSYMEDNTVSKFTNNAFYNNDRPLYINTYYNLSATNIFHNPANPNQKNTRNGIWLYNTTKQGATLTFAVTEVPFVISAFFNGGGSGATDVVNINADVIIKFEGASAGISRSNSRQVNLNAAAILTSIRDDSRGGDTNGDGSATTPADNDWDGYYNYATTSYISGANIFFDAH